MPSVICQNMKRKSSEMSLDEEWRQEEILELFAAIRKQCPSEDRLSYSVRANHIDWENMSIGERSAQECRSAWLAVQAQLRRYRTLEELVRDAEVLVQHTDLSVKPKGPSITPFKLFMETKLDEYKEKHADLSNLQVMNKLRSKYKNLSSRKKKKWVDKAVAFATKYQEQARAYRKENPDGDSMPLAKQLVLTTAERSLLDESVPEALLASTNGPKTKRLTRKRKFAGAPKKPPRSAYQVFVREKVGKQEGSFKDKMAALCAKWQNLSDKKRDKYKRRYLRTQEEYKEQLEEYQQTLSPSDLEEFKEMLKTKPQKKRRTPSNSKQETSD